MSSETANIIVTGASGFIGRACVEVMASTLPVTVHAISNTKATISDLPTAENIVWHRMDLLNQDLSEIVKLIQEVKPLVLLHLAWYVNPIDYKNSLENIRWMDASIRLFELFYAFGGGAIIGVGSCFEYISKSGQFLGNASSEPMNLYSESKYSTFLMGHHLAELYNRRFSWIRIFYAYGPYEYSQRIIPKLVDSFLLKTPFKVQSSGHHLLDYLYISDIADAVSLAIYHAMYGTLFPFLDLGSGRPVSLSTIVKSLEESFGYSSKDFLSFIPVRPEGPLAVVAKIKDWHKVGWVPKVDWAEGLANTVAYRREVLGL